MAFKNDVADDMAPIGHLVWPLVWPLVIAKPLRNHCKIVAKADGGQTGADRGPDGPPRLGPAGLPFGR
jgi:hypothetical protein